ncbi:MAG TPA: ABC transporter permease [Longimicrobiales bacterium]|nr:ABC transporter permease [Longimicrobiales bacterium]
MDPVRLRAIARKEWIQLRRDRRSMILAFVLPLFLLLFFGYAITWDVDDIPIAVLDLDKTRESRELVEALVASGYITVTEHLASADQVEARLVGDQALGVLTIPPGYAVDLAAPTRAAQVQLLLDGSDANTSTIALNYADAIVARHGARVALGGRPLEPPISLESRAWYNPDLESRHMIVPGLIAVIMSIIAAMLTALTIAREWERGTMEQLASTPVSRLEVVVGKLLPYLGIGLFDVAVTVAAGMLIFGTPLNGSVLLLGALTLLFLIGALGLGIFISAAVKSQVLATQIAMVSTYLPAVLLSGFLFDIASMPVVLRGVTFLIPARYFVTVTRGIFLKGVGAQVLWPQATLMLLYAVLGLTLATRAFRKELAT